MRRPTWKKCHHIIINQKALSKKNPNCCHLKNAMSTLVLLQCLIGHDEIVLALKDDGYLNCVCKNRVVSLCVSVGWSWSPRIIKRLQQRLPTGRWSSWAFKQHQQLQEEIRMTELTSHHVPLKCSAHCVQEVIIRAELGSRVQKPSALCEHSLCHGGYNVFGWCL